MTELHPNYQPPQAFRASFEGYTSNPDSLEEWANTVTVEAVTGYDPTADQTETTADQADDYADAHGNRELVEIDTNYKPTRAGQHPVRLTRTDAVKLAAAVLGATEDTFHYVRCGRLRPATAAELLEAIRDVEYQLTELRDHALTDLLIGSGLENDPMDTEPGHPPTDQPTENSAAANKAPAAEASTVSAHQQPAAEPVPAWRDMWPAEAAGYDTELSAALNEVFPTSVSAITESEAFGALAHKVNRRCRETGETPLQVLASIDPDDRAFALNANDPAAFLASRIDH